MEHHHYEHFWWRFFPKKELTHVYISSMLRSFAVSLVSLFVPLYLHVEQGFTLQQTLHFFIFYALILGISSPIAAKFCSRYGLKHSILLSVPFYVSYILLLYFLPTLKTPLFVLAILLGLAISFYWMGMHMVFHHASHKKHRGEEFGKRTALSISATMFGPLVGGALIKYFNFHVVFILSSIILVLSALSLFLSNEEHVRFHFSFRALMDKKHWGNALFFVSRGIRVASAGIIWPLFIFTILNDYLSLGSVGFILSGISALLILIMGKFSDHIDKRKIVRWTVGFEAVAWFLRASVSTVGQVFGVTVFGALTKGAMSSPLGALTYDKARGRVANYFVSRELYICLGRIMVLTLVLMVDNLTSGFILNGLATFLTLLF